MQSSGKTYEHSGNTTEWDDILIKKGIITREDALIAKGLNPADYIKEEEPVMEDAPDREEALNQLDLDEMDELEEDGEFADSRTLDKYRQQRIDQLKQAAFRNRFGEVRDIVKDEWIREVTEASNSCVVLVHLYENSIVECEVLDEAMRQLAPRFRYLKFLRIKSTHAVENWPEKNLPALFIYLNGTMKTQIVTLKQLARTSTKAEDLEWFLVELGIITDSELEEDPKLTRGGGGGARKKGTLSAGTVFRTSARDSDEDDDTEA